MSRPALPTQYRACTVDQQRAQVAITAFADAEQLHPTTSTRLAWHQPQEGGKLASRLKGARLTHRGNRRGSGQQSDPWNLGKPLALLRATLPGADLPLEHLDLFA